MSMFEMSEEELELENIYNRDWAEGEENPTNYVSENGFTEWMFAQNVQRIKKRGLVWLILMM